MNKLNYECDNTSPLGPRVSLENRDRCRPVLVLGYCSINSSDQWLPDPTGYSEISFVVEVEMALIDLNADELVIVRVTPVEDMNAGKRKRRCKFSERTIWPGEVWYG